jgi:hypothetical protein
MPKNESVEVNPAKLYERVFIIGAKRLFPELKISEFLSYLSICDFILTG